MYTKILLALAVLAMAGTYSIVFAQTDPDFADSESDCKKFEGTQELQNGTKITKMLDCKWISEEFIPRETNATASQPDLTDEEIEVIKDAIKCRSDPECKKPTVAEIPFNPSLKDNDEDRDELIEQNTKRACLEAEKDPDNEKKQDYCKSWTLATSCEQGVNEATPAQGYRNFLTTEFVLSAWKHYNFENDYWLMKLTSASLECLYQKTIVEGEVYGQQYFDIWKANINDGQPYHGDLPTSSGVQVQRLTQAVFDNHDNNVFNTFCSKVQFKALWASQGCPVKKIDDTCKMPTDTQLLGLNHAGLYNPRQLDGTLLPIKDYYIQKQIECIEKAKIAQSNSEQRISFGEYLQTLEPMQNANEYKANPKTHQPIGAVKSFIFVEPQQGDWLLWNNPP